MFAPHRKTLSSNRISTLDEYKRFLEQCSQDAKKSSKQQLVQKLYFTSKDLFKQQAEHLNPKEKGTILKLYIEFWKTHDCQMSLSEANYGANEDDSYYSKWPMTAGFNLSRAELAIEFSDLYFL